MAYIGVLSSGTAVVDSTEPGDAYMYLNLIVGYTNPGTLQIVSGGELYSWGGSNREVIGGGAAGTYLQSGGSNVAYQLNLGGSPGVSGSGNGTLSGGSLVPFRGGHRLRQTPPAPSRKAAAAAPSATGPLPSAA